jgi:O-antigen/teichoic acid export membrane protein
MCEKKIKIQASLLVKNTVLNFIGQVIPLLVALITVPYIVHGLGAERFGIFSLAFVVLGYLSILDLGLGRATTKFVAEALGNGEICKIAPIVWTSLVFIIILSLIGMIVLIALTPLLVERILKVSSYLIEEAKLTFYIMSISILLTLIRATLSGVLEAYQRFDILNAFGIPSNVLTFLIPVIVIYAGGNLPMIIILLLLKNTSVMILYFILCRKLIPSANPLSSINFTLAKSLFSFGSWIALHNAAVAILLYLDRFLVGVFLTMSAVAYYTAPYELVSRASIIPSSMMMVLFPAFSSLETIDKERLQNLFIRSFKYLILIMGLVLSIIFVFAREILLLWLGNEFAEKSTIVLQIFSVGVFFSSLAWLSGTLLQGIGKPKVVTIINTLQVPVYILSTWLLIKVIGIEGAALSWTLRVFLTLVLLLFTCWKENLFKPIFLLQNGSLKLVLVLGIISAITSVVKSFIPFSLINFALMLAVFTVLTFIIIWNIVSREDKAFVFHILISSLNFTKKVKGGINAR